MLRNYALDKQILNQYITKDKETIEKKPAVIVQSTYRKSKYMRKVLTNDQLVQKQYGLSKRQLDTLIEQMAQTYNHQWKVVSNALFKEHNIMISDRALNFRYYKLHPRNQKWGYSQEQSKQLLKMFYLQGKRYKQINTKFGYRGEHSIRNVLYSYSYKGFSKLQFYLRDQILQMSKDLVIDKKKSRKAFLLQTLILNYGLKWDYNKHALSLFYYFILATQEQIEKVPKDLAMLLYKRFIELIDEKRQQKKEMYQMIKPNLYEELQQVKQERNRLCANMFRIINKEKSKRDDCSQLDFNQYGAFIRQGKGRQQNNEGSYDQAQQRIFSQEDQQFIMNNFNDNQQPNLDLLLDDISYTQNSITINNNEQTQNQQNPRESQSDALTNKTLEILQRNNKMELFGQQEQQAKK